MAVAKRDRETEPSRFPYDPDFFTPQDIRTVDLAQVAALLLGRNDDDYANAALRALQLMDTCANVLRQNRKRTDAAKVRDQKLAAVGAAGLHARTPFNEADKNHHRRKTEGSR